MKKLNEALGYIDEKYLDEALMTKKSSSRPRLAGIIAAAVCVVLLTVSVAAIGMRYFAPGVGIVRDSSVRVLTSCEKLMLGGMEIDTVMMTDHLDGSATLTVWGYRENEVWVSPEDAEQGKAPSLLSEITAIIDGVEYRRVRSGFGTAGFAYYTFTNVPVSDSLILRSEEGDVSVSLIESDYSDRGDSIAFGDRALLVLPVGSGENVWALEYFDYRMQMIAADASDVSVHVLLQTMREDGKVGHMSGNAIPSGCDVKLPGCVTVGRYDYDKGVQKVSLVMADVNFNFGYESELPKVSVILPAAGESVDCKTVMYDANGILVEAVSLTALDGGFEVKLRIEDKKGEFDRDSLSAMIEIVDPVSVRGSGSLDDDGLYTLKYSFTNEENSLSEGDTLRFGLRSISWRIESGKFDPTCYKKNLGEAEF